MKRSEEEKAHYREIEKLCVIRNITSLICFTILAIVFKNFCLVFWSLLFYSWAGKEDE